MNAVAVPTMRDYALALAAAGYRIVPLPPGMKAAPPSGWPDLATNDAARIAQWWNAQPQANIAVVGGNGLLLLDVDTRKGGDASLAALEAKHGALPPTLTVLTPSGGRHFYFAGPDVENSASKIGAGLDIKSRSGYVVAPPSFTVAIPGKQSEGYYRWADVTVPIAPAPQWFIDLCGMPKVATDAPNVKLREATPGQWADIRAALDHLATVPAVASNQLWSDIGYALRGLGDEGRALWCEWSARAPGYGGPVTPEMWWGSHSPERAKCDFLHLFTLAREHGWVNPNPAGDPSAIQWSTASVPAGTPPPPPAGSAPVTLLTRADAIEPEPVRWLWKGYLARGKLNLLAGHGGTGKSVVTCRIAATVTTGGNWPDKSVLDEPANALIWSSEDDPADTIIPRLMAVGADLKRVHIITGAKNPDGSGRAFDPSKDMPQLRAEIERIGGAALLIIDPIVSAVSGDMHRANDVRRELQAVVDLAAERDCAVVGISHFTKGSAKSVPTERILGSVAFTALARIVLVCAQDEAGEMRVFMRSKSNLGLACDGFVYATESEILKTPAGPIETIKAVWGEAVTGSARELLAMLEPDDESQHEGGELGECKNALRAILTGADGALIEVPSRDVEAKLTEAGYKPKMIRKARVALRVTYRNEGFPRITVWRLPAPRTAGSVQRAEGFITPPPPTALEPPAPDPAVSAQRDLEAAQQLAGLMDALGKLNGPAAVTVAQVLDAEPLLGWLVKPQHERVVAERFGTLGYDVVKNTARRNGRWANGQTVYGRSDLGAAERNVAAATLGGGR